MRGILGTLGCAIVVLGASACGGDRQRDMSPITVEVVGDSLLRLTERTRAEGATNVECIIQFQARVSGPEGEHAVMQGGQIEYFWWQTGASAATFDWSQEAVAQLWVDSIFPVGQDRMSREQGFGQPPPGQLVRAEVTFEYRTSNTEEVKRTEPFRFYCY